MTPSIKSYSGGRHALILAVAVLVLFLRLCYAADPQKTQQLIAILQSDAALFEKARACQQLGEVGTSAAVPALAQLLNDDHLAAYARSGLEGIGGGEAAAALRSAAGKLKGNLLAGVVTSLGVLRDQQSVQLLIKLATDPSSGVSDQAFSALGKISNPQSIAFLKKELGHGAGDGLSGIATGCLLAAEEQLRQKNLSSAQELYDAVLKTPVAAVYRVGATRGAILARKSDQISFLLQKLRSNDSVARNAALFTIHEIPSLQLAAALNRELPKAPPDLQVQILSAIEVCHNHDSIELLKTMASAANPRIQRAALNVFVRIVDANEAEFLLRIVANAPSTDETAIAAAALERMDGSSVDKLTVDALSAVHDASTRVKLIRLLDARATSGINGALLKQAADSDPQVAGAALEALQSRAGGQELPALVALIKSSKEETTRLAAERTVSAACKSMGNPGAEVILADLSHAENAALKQSWVRVLTQLGYAPALPAINQLLSDQDDAVALEITDQLGQWPDPSPVDTLLGVANNSSDVRRRRRALASAIRLTHTAAEEHQRPNPVTIGWFERAAKVSSTPAEKRLIISGLGLLPDRNSLSLLAPYLDQPNFRNEASVAILQIAPELAKQDCAELLAPALEKISATAPVAEVANQARKIAATLPAPAEISLFDGSSLNGWEGNTNVWRVSDRVIVGGSMFGNPRNEFLATTRSYTNFVLRLEYRLIGTEGFINSGVQFHSVRVTQPPNEMSGYQADIGAGYSGCLYDESRRNKFLVQADTNLVKRLERVGEWNQYEVRCQGSHIQILLNGQTTVEFTETDPDIPHQGLIALQIHGGSKATVSFRNIRIREML